MSRARDLAKLGNTDVIAVNGTDVGFGTLDPKEKVNVVGVVSATSFYGDGSTLDGIASAGIGTALSDDKTKALNAIYYTNNELTLNTTSTINPPDSGHIAYTQAPTLVIEDTKEIIVSDGDDLLVDVLGIATGVNVDYAARGNGVFGNIYVDNIYNQSGQTSVNFPLGFVSSGITTITNINQSTSTLTGALQVRGGVGIAKSVYIGGNLSVGGTITYEDVTNVDSVGLITARNGIKVTAGGVNVTGIITTTGSGPAVRLLNSDGSNFADFKRTSAGETRIENSGADPIVFRTNSNERLRIGSVGQIGLAGANYGTSGQVMTSQGNSAAPQWATPSGGSWEVVSTQVLSGSTQYIDYNGWSNAYQKYQLVFNDVYYNHTNFNIYLRIYQDATSGNTGTLKSASSYAANCFTSEATSNSGSGGWTGWTDYHKLGNNSAVPLWHGTYDWYMQQPVSTPSGNNEAAWGGTNLMERSIGINDSCIYGADKSEYITGIRVYFFDQGSAISPTGGRFTLYRMKYS